MYAEVDLDTLLRCAIDQSTHRYEALRTLEGLIKLRVFNCDPRYYMALISHSEQEPFELAESLMVLRIIHATGVTAPRDLYLLRLLDRTPQKDLHQILPWTRMWVVKNEQLLERLSSLLLTSDSETQETE